MLCMLGAAIVVCAASCVAQLAPARLTLPGGGGDGCRKGERQSALGSLGAANPLLTLQLRGLPGQLCARTWAWIGWKEEREREKDFPSSCAERRENGERGIAPTSPSLA